MSPEWGVGDCWTGDYNRAIRNRSGCPIVLWEKGVLDFNQVRLAQWILG